MKIFFKIFENISNVKVWTVTLNTIYHWLIIRSLWLKLFGKTPLGNRICIQSVEKIGFWHSDVMCKKITKKWRDIFYIQVKFISRNETPSIYCTTKRNSHVKNDRTWIFSRRHEVNVKLTYWQRLPNTYCRPSREWKYKKPTIFESWISAGA